jgi:aminoglycoside phosphotransferase (APT) family kinase protein
VSESILRISPELASAYVRNTADALARLLPEMEGNARASVEECARTLFRTALHLDPAAHGVTATITDLKSEAAALAGMEAAASSLLGALVAADPGEVVGGRGFDRAALSAYLRAHPLGGDNTRIIEARLLAGGRSKQTVLLQIEGARDLPADIVVRRDWASSVTGTSVVSEYELLRVVHQQGIKVPQPLLLETSPNALGSPFIVMRRVAGQALGDPFTPPPSAGPVLDLARELGKLHSLDAGLFAGMQGVVEENITRQQLHEKLTAYAQVIASFATPSVSIDAALAWLHDHLDQVECHKTLVHADLSFHNLLCDGDSLGSILDWELAHIGNPALDLGYLRSVVTQKVEWETFLDAYRQAGGPSIPASTIDFYTLFASIWLYQLLLQARAAIASGQVADMEIAHVCAHFIPALLARVSRELELVVR